MNSRAVITVLLLSSVAVQALPPVQRVLQQDEILVQPGLSSSYAQKENKIISTSNEAVLRFDDVELQNPLGNITCYNGFNFEGFQVLDFPRASQEGLVEPQDITCATSAPNALLGSRVAGQPVPRFMLESALRNTTTRESPHGPEYFKLQSISMKALGDVPKYLSIYIQGWEIKDGRAINSYYLSTTYLAAGYHSATRVNLTKYGWWPNGINAIEAYAEATDGRDWRFCIDDIDIKYV